MPLLDESTSALSADAGALENDGHEVSFAQGGTEYLARLESFRAEVALVDVGLPGMDGYEVARRVRKLLGS